MSEFYIPQPEDFSERHESIPSLELMDCLRGYFEDAYRQKYESRSFNLNASHGAFVKNVPLEVGHVLTRGADRLVLKLPHPFDTPNSYYEVFAVNLRGRDGHEVADTSGVFADQYLIRETREGESGPFLLADEDGLYHADLNIFDEIEGFSKDPNSGHDVLAIQECAQRLLQELRMRHIVSSVD